VTAGRVRLATLALGSAARTPTGMTRATTIRQPTVASLTEREAVRSIMAARILAQGVKRVEPITARR